MAPDTSHTIAKRNRWTLVSLLALVAGMGMLAYASVPLYRLFCQITGYGGTTQTAAAVPAEPLDRTLTVRFNADTDPHLAWQFKPLQKDVKVRVGERKLIAYEAVNNTDKPLVGVATYNVTPYKVGSYFNKIQCFCFENQLLEPGQSMHMPVSFFIDPEFVADKDMNDVQTVTLSYTFFPAKEDVASQ